MFLCFSTLYSYLIAVYLRWWYYVPLFLYSLCRIYWYYVFPLSLQDIYAKFKEYHEDEVTVISMQASSLLAAEYKAQSEYNIVFPRVSTCLVYQPSYCSCRLGFIGAFSFHFEYLFQLSMKCLYYLNLLFCISSVESQKGIKSYCNIEIMSFSFPTDDISNTQLFLIHIMSSFNFL